MAFFVYILHSASADKYYVGQTNDIYQRLNRHNSGYVSSTAPYIPWKLVFTLEKPNRSEAMALEKKLKNLSRERLLKFIEKYG